MIILVHGSQWLQYGGDRIDSVAPYPTLAEDTQLVWQPTASLSGVALLSGNPRYAAVLIERRLRAEGALDGEVKVFVHRIEKFGQSYQALYSTAKLDEWQALQAWIDQQRCHCLVFPSVAVLLRQCRPGRAAAMVVNGQVTVLALAGRHLVHASALAFSDSADDLQLTVHGLSEGLVEDLRKAGPDAVGVEQVAWYPVAFGGDEADLQRVTEGFLGELSPKIELMSRPVESAEHHRIVACGLAAFTVGLASSIALNSDGQKALYLATRYLPLGLAASVALAAAALGASAHLAVQGHGMENALREGRQEVAKRRAEIAQLEQGARLPADQAAELRFIQSMTALQRKVDPASLLWALRQASGDAIRILSVRSVLPKSSTATATATAAAEPEAGSEVLVEGALPLDGGPTKARLLSGFVKRLEESGYQVSAADARTAGTGTDNSNLFAYRLTRSAATAEAR